MRTIHLNFSIHKPYILNTYHFFDINSHKEYFDEQKAKEVILKADKMYYAPSLEMFYSLVKRLKSGFKFSITISGFCLEQLQKYNCKTIQVLKALALTDCVEFICTPYNHGLSSEVDDDEFDFQVKKHKKALKEILGVEAKCFQNTEMIYTNNLAKKVADLGFESIFVDDISAYCSGCSNNFVFSDKDNLIKLISKNQNISLLMENGLKDNNLFEPLFFAQQLNNIDFNDNVINIRINTELLNSDNFNNKEVVIFFKNLTEKIANSGLYNFMTPSQIIKNYSVKQSVDVSIPVSDVPNNLSAWLGNELQKEAYNKLFYLKDKLSDNQKLAFDRLQCSDYLYFMSDRFYDNLQYNFKESQFKNQYESFINYMNVISDLYSNN